MRLDDLAHLRAGPGFETGCAGFERWISARFVSLLILVFVLLILQILTLLLSINILVRARKASVFDRIPIFIILLARACR